MKYLFMLILKITFLSQDFTIVKYTIFEVASSQHDGGEWYSPFH